MDTEFHQTRAAFEPSDSYIRSSHSLLKVTREIIFTKTLYILVNNNPEYIIKAKIEQSPNFVLTGI